MAVVVFPAIPEDARILLDIGSEAFNDGFNQMMFSTIPLSETSMSHLEQIRRNAMIDNPYSHVFKAVDTDTNEIIAGSKWAVVHEAEIIQNTVDEEVDALLQTAIHEARIDVMREFYTKLWTAKRANLGYLDGEVFKLRARIELDSLYTHPKHQRRGAASKLMQWGFDESDRLGLDIYLEATVEGKPVYEKYGFEEVSTFDIDASKYGKEGIYRYTVCSLQYHILFKLI